MAIPEKTSNVTYAPPLNPGEASPSITSSASEENSSTSYKVALFAAAFLLAGGLALGGTSVFFYLKAGLVLKTWIFIGSSSGALVGSITVFVVGKILKTKTDDIGYSYSSEAQTSTNGKTSPPVFNYTAQKIDPENFINMVNDKSANRAALFAFLKPEEFDQVIRFLNTVNPFTQTHLSFINYLVENQWSTLSKASLGKNLITEIVKIIKDKVQNESEMEKYIETCHSRNLKESLWFEHTYKLWEVDLETFFKKIEQPDIDPDTLISNLTNEELTKVLEFLNTVQDFNESHSDFIDLLIQNHWKRLNTIQIELSESLITKIVEKIECFVCSKNQMEEFIKSCVYSRLQQALSDRLTSNLRLVHNDLGNFDPKGFIDKYCNITYNRYALISALTEDEFNQLIVFLNQCDAHFFESSTLINQFVQFHWQCISRCQGEMSDLLIQKIVTIIKDKVHNESEMEKYIETCHNRNLKKALWFEHTYKLWEVDLETFFKKIEQPDIDPDTLISNLPIDKLQEVLEFLNTVQDFNESHSDFIDLLIQNHWQRLNEVQVELSENLIKKIVEKIERFVVSKDHMEEFIKSCVNLRLKQALTDRLTSNLQLVLNDLGKFDPEDFIDKYCNITYNRYALISALTEDEFNQLIAFLNQCDNKFFESSVLIPRLVEHHWQCIRHCKVEMSDLLIKNIVNSVFEIVDDEYEAEKYIDSCQNQKLNLENYLHWGSSSESSDSSDSEFFSTEESDDESDSPVIEPTKSNIFPYGGHR